MMAAEAEPFAKGGGLGDAVTGMAVALAGAGVKVSVFLPLYAEVARRGHRPRATGREVTLAHDGREHTAALHRARRDGVDFIFVREDGYFGRDAIYGTPAGEYPDSPQRYSFFTRAALAGAEALGLAPDVVHCHDWHAALAPWYLGGGTLRQARGGEGRRRPPVLLTVHNLAYQGIYDASLVGPLGLPPEGFGMEGYEFYGGINFLKGGLMAADAINTVSPTYAREILVPGMGEGLDGVLRARQGAAERARVTAPAPAQAPSR